MSVAFACDGGVVRGLAELRVYGNGRTEVAGGGAGDRLAAQSIGPKIGWYTWRVRGGMGSCIARVSCLQGYFT